MLLTFGVTSLLEVRAMARLFWENKGQTGKIFSAPRNFLYFAAQKIVVTCKTGLLACY